jgi:hypothetical protein
MAFNFSRNQTIQSVMKSGMPQMGHVLDGWEVPLTLIKIIQDVINGELAYTEIRYNFKGVWQPLRDEQLELKPEAVRSWEWIWIHAKSSELNLETGDKVYFNSKFFKVSAKKDYGLNGYVEYQLCRDFETGNISDKDQ